MERLQVVFGPCFDVKAGLSYWIGKQWAADGPFGFDYHRQSIEIRSCVSGEVEDRAFYVRLGAFDIRCISEIIGIKKAQQMLSFKRSGRDSNPRPPA
ncbi:MAG: hypothetical protein RLY31_630 [Bacteroidota bacterium]